MLLENIKDVKNGRIITHDKDDDTNYGKKTGIELKIGKSEKIIIEFVDGQKVRDEYDQDFTMGGHHYRYDFIPENEVWIEKEKEEDMLATIVHELTERTAMKYLGEDYDKAHSDFANNVEKDFRDAYHKDIKKDNEKVKGGEKDSADGIFAPGDKVKVARGQFAGKSGTVKSASGRFALVSIDGSEVSIDVSNLSKE